MGETVHPLIVCPTPIGNLDDVTPRQRAALAGADVIACEDTRVAGKLLERLGIVREGGKPALVRFDDHSGEGRVDALVARLAQGARVTLVSDAGTPAISDPGFELVAAVRAAGLDVVALPGPCAAIVALSMSGLPTDHFRFEGFPARKTAARRARLQELAGAESQSTVFYESPHRVCELLADIAHVWGPQTPTFVGRELTKMHEESVGGTVSEVAGVLCERASVRGECVVVAVSPRPAPAGSVLGIELVVLLQAAVDAGVPTSAIKKLAAKLYPVADPKAVYDEVVRLKG